MLFEKLFPVLFSKKTNGQGDRDKASANREFGSLSRKKAPKDMRLLKYLPYFVCVRVFFRWCVGYLRIRIDIIRINILLDHCDWKLIHIVHCDSIKLVVFHKLA